MPKQILISRGIIGLGILGSTCITGLWNVALPYSPWILVGSFLTVAFGAFWYFFASQKSEFGKPSAEATRPSLIDQSIHAQGNSGTIIAPTYKNTFQMGVTPKLSQHGVKTEQAPNGGARHIFTVDVQPQGRRLSLTVTAPDLIDMLVTGPTSNGIATFNFDTLIKDGGSGWCSWTFNKPSGIYEITATTESSTPPKFTPSLEP
ncbi:hypothetical protein ACIQT7_05800 [Agrobacterium deltaense]